MFISVNQQLPQTAYIKMVDVWLIFNLLIPFILVLVHTYVDSLRTEVKSEDGEERKINHHGKSILVGNLSNKNPPNVKEAFSATSIVGERDADLIHRNEELELNV